MSNGDTNDTKDTVVEQVEVAPQVEGATEDADFDYEKEFNAQVAKREAEKAGNNVVEQKPTSTEPAAEVADQPQTEAVETPAPASESKEPVAPAPKVPTRDEIIAALPENLREAAKAAYAAGDAAAERAKTLEHDVRSQAGRVAAYQRKYEEAKGKKPAEVNQAEVDAKQKKWIEFKENYPEVAEAMESRLDSVQPGVPANVEQMAQFVEDEMRNRFLTEASDAVAAVHPNWVETARSEEFQTWKATSPAYERLASSDDVADAIALMDLWKGSRPAAAPAPVVDPKIAADAAKLAAKRGAQVEGGKAATTQTAAPNANVDLNDPDQLFAYYASKSNSRMKSRNA